MEQHKLLSSNVSLTGYEVRPDEASKVKGATYVVYAVQVRWGESTWTVWRRYNDFAKLHHRLQVCFGSRQLPHLTSSHVSQIMKVGKDTFVARRMMKLEQYLRYVVEYVDSWAPDGDSFPVGWGTVLGINQILFEFFDVENNAVMPRPQTHVIEGKSVVCADGADGDDAGYGATMLGTARLVSERDVDALVVALRNTAGGTDEAKLDVLYHSLGGLTKNGEKGLNLVQAAAVVAQFYFGDARVNAARELMPYLCEFRQSDVFLDCFDFSEDEEQVAGMLKEAADRARRAHSINA
eukprot:PhM_4_TR15210/c0_g2_i1/m.1760